MDTVNNTFVYAGAVAGIIAFLWQAFAAYAAKSSATWDDKIVNIVNNIVKPTIEALERNTTVTAANTEHTAANTQATDANTQVAH